MGIKSLFGFGQARDKPVDKAADAGYSFLFGRTTSGKPVNERTAMQTTAVYACVRILAEAVASLPLHVYEYQDDGGKKLAAVLKSQKIVVKFAAGNLFIGEYKETKGTNGVLGFGRSFTSYPAR